MISSEITQIWQQFLLPNFGRLNALSFEPLLDWLDQLMSAYSQDENELTLVQ